MIAPGEPASANAVWHRQMHSKMKDILKDQFILINATNQAVIRGQAIVNYCDNLKDEISPNQFSFCYQQLENLNTALVELYCNFEFKTIGVGEFPCIELSNKTALKSKNFVIPPFQTDNPSGRFMRMSCFHDLTNFWLKYHPCSISDSFNALLNEKYLSGTLLKVFFPSHGDVILASTCQNTIRAKILTTGKESCYVVDMDSGQEFEVSGIFFALDKDISRIPQQAVCCTLSHNDSEAEEDTKSHCIKLKDSTTKFLLCNLALEVTFTNKVSSDNYDKYAVNIKPTNIARTSQVLNSNKTVHPAPVSCCKSLKESLDIPDKNHKAESMKQCSKPGKTTKQASQFDEDHLKPKKTADPLLTSFSCLEVCKPLQNEWCESDLAIWKKQENEKKAEFFSSFNDSSDISSLIPETSGCINPEHIDVDSVRKQGSGKEIKQEKLSESSGVPSVTTAHQSNNLEKQVQNETESSTAIGDERCYITEAINNWEFPESDAVDADMYHPETSSKSDDCQNSFNALKIPLRGNKIRFLITKIEDVNHFFGILIDDECEGKEIGLVDLIEYMNSPDNLEKAENLSAPPTKGQLVLAKDLVYNTFYRATVLDLHSDSSEVDVSSDIEVLYVDFGTTEKLKLENIKKIDVEYLILPFQALEFHVSDLEPINMHNSTDETPKEAFAALVADDTEIEAEVINSNKSHRQVWIHKTSIRQCPLLDLLHGQVDRISPSSYPRPVIFLPG